jgi:non-ribosomal peptide synthetase-like protein
MVAASFGTCWMLELLLLLLSLPFMNILELNSEKSLILLFGTDFNLIKIFSMLFFLALQLPIILILQAFAANLMGRVPEGVISRWSVAYIRIWLKTGIVEWAGRWLSGTLFWPVWLRLAGMRVGKGCEISTIVDVVPELIDLGDECFFADGIYLGGPRIHRGSVTLSKVKIDKNAFLGNHVVIQGGQHLPEDILLGICTVADNQVFQAGSSWFGRPAFQLPRRGSIEYDRRFTHYPSFIRYINRLFWESMRFALPVGLACVFYAWADTLMVGNKMFAWFYFIAFIIPLLNFSLAAFICIAIVLLKWILLGRVHPGKHPLWSCWCSRWDFLYVAWGVCARSFLSPLQGTLLIHWYLRAMGAKIGRYVLLNDRITQMVDPDMMAFEDGATVNCLFQAHTFEDRVLKIDRVIIRRQATVGHESVLLYGADIGMNAYVAPFSVVMKHERLSPNRFYAGAPTRSYPMQRAVADSTLSCN